MKAKKTQLFIILSITCICLLTVYGLISSHKPRMTLGLTDDEINALPYVEFLFPAGENPSLASDIYTTIFEEDQSMHYLIVPHDFVIDKAVCYALDPAGQYLNRYVIDFSNDPEYMVGYRCIILAFTDLPLLTLDINDGSPSIAELDASEKTVECSGILNMSADDEHMRGSVAVTGRGNVSWYSSPKKSYTVDFGRSTYLPGLGRNRKWNLISNSQDKTLLNNDVFYRMADRVGIEFEPSYSYVSVYIDHRYHGVYMLTSKISVDPDRVALGNGDFFMNFGDPDTSSAIYYSSDIWMDNEGTTRPYVNIKWPGNSSPEELAREYNILQPYITSLEDPEDDGYTDYIDIDNMVRYYWIQEISMNYDADYRSAYAYYRDSTKKIYMGPVWDMDIALGWNDTKFGADFTTPQGWKLRGMSWYACLFGHAGFEEAAAEAYYNGGIREAMFDALEYYKQQYAKMANDGRFNYRRWRSDWPNLAIRHGENYDDECMGRIDFFTQRVEWIDTEMSKYAGTIQ